MHGYSHTHTYIFNRRNSPFRCLYCLFFILISFRSGNIDFFEFFGFFPSGNLPFYPSETQKASKEATAVVGCWGEESEKTGGF